MARGEDLTELPGIGRDLAAHIAELSGRPSKEVPEEVLEPVGVSSARGP